MGQAKSYIVLYCKRGWVGGVGGGGGPKSNIQSSHGKMTDHFAFQSSRKTLIWGFRIILKESFLCVFEPLSGD